MKVNHEAEPCLLLAQLIFHLHFMFDLPPQQLSATQSLMFLYLGT